MVKVGLIGYGFVAQLHISGYKTLKGGKLVAGCEIRPERRKKLKKDFPDINIYTSIEDMFKNERLDMVDICLPTFLHKMAVKKSAEYGAHILCEKPMALNVKECRQMIKAADKNKVKLMVGHVLRFWPEYIKAKEILDSRKLGKARWISAFRVVSWPVWDWRHWLHDPKKSGGAALDLHIHDLDFFRWILGEPDKVYAASLINKRSAHFHTTTTLKYRNGSVAHAEGGFGVPPAYPFTMTFCILCEKGAIELKSGELTSYTSNKKKIHKVKGPDGYSREIQYFVDCIRKGKYPKIITPEDAMKSVGLARAAIKSAILPENL